VSGGRASLTGVETTWDRVRAWRLRRHHLADRDAAGAVAVARRLAGVQAQVASSAEQAVAVRRPARVAGVDEALADRTLVRTWAMRGTLHLLPADEAPAYLSLLAAARTWAKPAWQREFATLEQLDALAAALVPVLDGAALTREELVAAVADPSLHAHLASGWGTVLKPLAWQGLLCNGPPRDGRPTFTSPAGFLPGWPGLPDADVAAAAVIPAYLGAHGPANPDRFDQWLLRGATPKARLRRWFADLVEGGVLAPVTVDGEELVIRAADRDDLADAAPVPGVRLLPGFDQWVLGPGTSRPEVVPPTHRARVSRAAGWIAPLVLDAGRTVGTWSVAGGEPVLDPFPDSAPVDPAALAEEVEQWRPLLAA